ncbi:MAG: hypothetical protein JW874_07260 [Spirochaetales bacterium]|nr:hypothetical protein [Spirochaetales bacterium]
MKKTLLVLAILCLPIAVFADFQVGAAAYLNIPLTPEQVEVNELSFSDFLFGADVRFNLGPLSIQGTGFYRGGDDYTSSAIGLYTDIGLLIDLAVVRLSLGVGPNFTLLLDDGVSDAARIGANVKASGEIVIGNLAFALNWMMLIENLAVEDILYALENPYGYLGLSVLYKLF